MEDNKVVKKAIDGFKYTFSAQVVVLLLSVAKSFILPKILSIPDYGYWQVYVLYSTYVGIFALGYNDGIYLKYGKYQYSELPLQKLRTATRYYVSMLLVFMLIAGVASVLFVSGNRLFTFIGVCIDIFLMGINGLLIYILQTTNQMKAYSFYSILDKVVLLIAVVIICFIPERSFEWVVVADVVSKASVTMALCYKFKDLFIGEGASKKEGRLEFIDDIKVGINLMIANLMGMFVTGIGRFLVDAFGDIEEYAFYSFGMTITNLVLVFITAVSLVLYPTLKRLPESNYGAYFEKLNVGVVGFNAIALFAYFPAVVFIKMFLPQYAPMLVYVHFLFGVIVLQAKMQLLNNTFYKVMREEKALLRANMSCVAFFLIIAFVSFYITREVTAIAVCTFVAMLYRCYASEIFLRKKMSLGGTKKLIVEIAFVISYVVAVTVLDFIPALVIYVAVFGAFIIYLYPELKKYGFSIKKRK